MSSSEPKTSERRVETDDADDNLGSETALSQASRQPEDRCDLDEVC